MMWGLADFTSTLGTTSASFNADDKAIYAGDIDSLDEVNLHGIDQAWVDLARSTGYVVLYLTSTKLASSDLDNVAILFRDKDQVGRLWSGKADTLPR